MEGIIDSVAGLCSGAAAVLVCSPLDVARTRLQVQALHGQFEYKNLLNALTRISREEGVAAFYKGLRPSLIAYCISWGTYFPVYDSIRESLSSRGYASYYASLIGSCVGGTISSITANPLWVLRTRMTVNSAAEFNVTHCFLQIYRTEGAAAFFQGLQASMFGIVHVAVFFPLYQAAKAYFHEEDQVPKFWHMIICVAGPKVVASLCSYPHEVLRARLYMRNRATEQRYQCFRSVFKHTYATEGVRGLYSGFGANLFRIVPSAFITLYTYELVKAYLHTVVGPRKELL